MLAQPDVQEERHVGNDTSSCMTPSAGAGTVEIKGRPVSTSIIQ